MGPFATVVLAGCLKALGVVLWGIAGLIVVLVVVQRLRGDGGADPVALMGVALVCLVLGFVCAKIGRAAGRG